LKKLFVVLAAMLFLAIMACSSGSGDSSSGSSSNTTSAIVNSTGGSVQLADGANATIPAGAVADNTQVTLTKLAQPQVSASQATAVTDTYQIDIPAGSITGQSGSNNFVTFQIPVPTSTSTTVKKALSSIKALATSSNADDAYYVSEVTISNDTSTSTLYGRYTVSNGVATVSVVNSALASSVSTTSKLANKSIASTSASIKATIITMHSYFSSSSIEEGLYNVNSSSPYQPVNSVQNTGGKIPIILVHGLQINDSNDYHPEKDTWKYFVDYFNSSDENLKDRFPLYTYRYDTTKSIDSNGADFATMITKCFPSQKVIIIAHSMGGLVAHSYIQNHSGGSKVNKLITLATPYHGSPLVQGIGAIALVEFPYFFLVMGTAGSLDLAWDNYPNATKDDNMNAFLFELNNKLSTSQYASLYNAFAGSNLDNSHGGLKASYEFLNVLGYESDGVVPLVSAFNNGHPQGFVPQDTPDGEKNYDHFQMTGKKSTDQLFNTIKDILGYNISGTVTLNGTGLAGVTVTLTGIGTSSTVTTDANGVYTFSNAANGSYTLTPSLTGYTFSPSSVPVVVNNGDETIQDIIATVNSNPINPTIAQLPMKGPAGTTFTDWGTGFTPNSTATLHFMKPDGTEYPTSAQSIDGNGTFSISYASPTNKPAGTYTWWGVDSSGKVSNTVSYTITIKPTVAQTPMSVKLGETVTQWGTGFTPGSTATLHFRKPDNSEFTPVSQAIKSDGTFSITYTIPTDRTPGTYTWWGIDSTGKGSNMVSFTVATITTYSMIGIIHAYSDSGPVIPGAKVSISIAGKTTITSSTGVFSITGIPSGTYAFSVAKAGFDTYTNTAYYVGSNQTNLDFYLNPLPPIGAFAWNTSNCYVAGLSWNYSTIDLAAQSALQACGAGCSIVGVYGKGTCAAYAKGDGGCGAAWAFDTLAEAKSAAIGACGQYATGCIVELSGCNNSQ
jgi:pimeloyl-ACP methyl ester carboxylesterase